MIASLQKSVFAGLVTCGFAVFANTASADGYNVDINKTEVLRLPGAAAAVVIGNPDIADVSVHSIDTLFLVGRSYGETNLIVLDEFGQTMLNTDIRVGSPVPRNGVQIHRMGDGGRESYNCNPYCLPAPTLGDNGIFRGEFQGTAAPITNTTVTGPASGPAASPVFTMPPGAPYGFEPLK